MATTDTTTDTTDRVQEAEQLADDMAETKARTTEGTVEGTVNRIYEHHNSFSGSDKYKVHVETPHGGFTHRFDKPSAWTRDYAFVRWVEGLGYTAENFHHLVKDEVRVAVAVDVEGDDELVVPKKRVRTLVGGVWASVLDALRGMWATLTDDIAVAGLWLMVLSLPVLFFGSVLVSVTSVPAATVDILTIVTFGLGAAVFLVGMALEEL